jgi:hypothetical protein
MQSFVGLLVCEKNVDRNTFCMKHDNILYKECTSVVAFTTYKSAKIDFNIYNYIFTLLNTIEIIIIYLDIPRFNRKWAWLNGCSLH